jgi:hypothetical protein
MASGLPLVAPNSGGVISYANLENAWTGEASVISFAAAIQELIANEELRAKKTANALLTAGQYRWETATSAFLDLYSEMHHAAQATDRSLAPAFWSTKAYGLQAASFHGVSQAAQKIFSMATRFAKRRPSQDLTPISADQLNP